MAEALEPLLESYVRSRLPNARLVRVDEFARIPGGASRETYRFRLRIGDERGGSTERRLILRRDPPDSLIETERKIEFAAYRAFFGTAVPVPEMLWLEEDRRWLGAPFFIAAEITGFESSLTAVVEEPYASRARELGKRKWTILGEIARQDAAALGLAEVMAPVAPDAAWKRELDYWEGVIDSDSLEPQPIIRAAIRWLRANPPPPAEKVSVVHGDYRIGNLLYDAEGGIHGILDWEMAHLGDPLEDLGWSLNRVWCVGHDDRRGGLLPKEEAVRIWEKASGLRAVPEALRWWELLGCVKGQAIWISAPKAWTDGGNRDPILVVSGWWLTNSQDRAALELLGRL